MTSRTFASFREASAFAKDLAQNSGIPAQLTRNASGWSVQHPNISDGDPKPIHPKQRENPINRDRSTSYRRRQPYLKATDNHFTFSIRKNSSTEPVLAQNPNKEKGQIVELVRQYFDNATIDAEVKVMDVAGFKFSDFRREYLIVIRITDKSMPREDFEELVNDLAVEFDYLHLDY